MVAFRLMPGFKATAGRLGRPPAPGYDAGIAGRYKVSLEELADLLNRRRQQALAGGPGE
jgi:hypothetical protein